MIRFCLISCHVRPISKKGGKRWCSYCQPQYLYNIVASNARNSSQKNAGTNSSVFSETVLYSNRSIWDPQDCRNPTSSRFATVPMSGIEYFVLIESGLCMCKVTPVTCASFGPYMTIMLKKWTNHRGQVWIILLASALAQLVSCVVTCPVEAVRIRVMTCDKRPELLSFVGMAQKMAQEEGLLYFWSGLGALLFRELPFATAKVFLHRRTS